MPIMQVEVHEPRDNFHRHRYTQHNSQLEIKKENTMTDLVNHPPHYTSHPSGIECIQITEHMGFNLGNAVKYIWRADLKADTMEDLRKARWYIDREIQKRTVR